MVRLIGLAAAVAACWACAPAQAAALGVEVPAAAPSASVPSVSVPAADRVVSDVKPVVDQVTKSVPVVSAPADETLRKATAAAQPAVAAAVDGTTRIAQVAQGRAGDTGGLRVGASSLRRAPSARLRHAKREAPAPVRAARAERPAQAAATATPPSRERAAAPAAHTAPQPGSDPAPQRSSGAGGGVSAGFAFAGAMAVLAVGLMLLAPHLRRRLSIDTAVLRPVAFVALLERPG
jgi:hypothetical protein